MKGVKRPGKVGTVASAVALAVIGVAAAFGVVSADDRHHGPGPNGSASRQVTQEARKVLALIQDAGLPIERPTVLTRDTDPDHLLGETDGYHSKASFEDGRVDGGLVADNDPGSVALGGVIEVFESASAAKERAAQLQRDADGIPTRSERGYLVRGVLLRLSPYLDEQQAEQYRRAIGARRAPTAAPSADVREA